MSVRRILASVVLAGVLVGCTASPAPAGPLQARQLDGWSLAIDNSQHSAVWTFNGFQACATRPVSQLKFLSAHLTDPKGSATIRAALDSTGEVPADVEPRPLRSGLQTLDSVTNLEWPATDCSAPTKVAKFSFEVTSEQAWSAEGFSVDYQVDGSTYTLVWDMPVSVCAPSGC